MAATLVLMVHTGTRQALHHALSVAMTAQVSGEDVLMALFYDGLAAWWAAHADEPTQLSFGDLPHASQLEAGFRRLGVPSTPAMVADCRQLGVGSLRVVACGGSVEALGLTVSQLLDTGGVDDVLGLPTLWRRAAGARIVSI